MVIDSSSGVVSWSNPIIDPIENPYTVTIRASNSFGSNTESWSLEVIKVSESGFIPGTILLLQKN